MTFRSLIICSFIFAIILDSLQSATGECSRPEEIDHMQYGYLDSYPEGTVVTYKCAEGYAVDDGNGNSICTKSGTDFSWTKPTLTCLPRSCPQPPRIDNGRIVGTDFTFGKTVEYECNSGYVLKSASGLYELVCLQDGSWNGQPPTCEAVKCPKLTTVTRGGASSTSNDYNTKVTFTCNQGYMLVGSREIQCLGDGTWSNPQPKCEDIECPDPADDAFKAKNKDVIGRLDLGLGVNQGVTFTCEGEPKEFRSKCDHKGEWSPPPPNCVKEVSTTTVSVTTTTVETTVSVATSVETTVSVATSTESALPPKLSTSSPTTVTTDSVNDTDRPKEPGGATDEYEEPSPETPTKETHEEESGLPSWVIVLLAFLGASIVILVIALILRKRMRKNSYRSADKEKAEAEMDSLANNAAHV